VNARSRQSQDPKCCSKEKDTERDALLALLSSAQQALKASTVFSAIHSLFTRDRDDRQSYNDGTTTMKSATAPTNQASNHYQHEHDQDAQKKHTRDL
jgi:hypothetical protein